MEELTQKYIKKIEDAIEIATELLYYPDCLSSKLDHELLNIGGMSNKENRIFLNELIDYDSKYLEIGLHRGSTFISAVYKNEPKIAVGIDDFGGPMYSDTIKNQFLMNAKRFNVNSMIDFTLIHEDSFNLKQSDKEILKKEKFNIYFYDGGHTLSDHEKSLTYYYEYLEDIFIFIVDDWVHQPAVDGTRAGIEKCNLKIIKEWTLGHSQRINIPDKLSWHNGIYIAILQK